MQRNVSDDFLHLLVISSLSFENFKGSGNSKKKKKEKLRKRKEEDAVKCRWLHNSVTGDEVQKGIGGKKVGKEEVASTAV